MPPRKSVFIDNEEDTIITSGKRAARSSEDGPLVSLHDSSNPQHQLMTRPWQYRFHQAVVSKDSHSIPKKPIDSTVSPILPKVAAFDMDSTLIKVKSGEKFARDADDWLWLYPKVVVEKLVELHTQGYEIVIFTNQLDCIAEKRINNIQKKIDTLTSELGFPISVYIATKKDMFRKPSRGLFDLMLDRYYELLVEQYPEQHGKFGNVIDESSFYVGDAAGRSGLTPSQAKKAPGRIKDHSSADYQFALNCFSLDPKYLTSKHFFVPEAFFLTVNKNSENDHTKMSFDGVSPYSLIPLDGLSSKLEQTALYDWLSRNNDAATKGGSALPQLIVFTGGPATGKTGLAHQLIDHWNAITPKICMWVNQDTLKTADKCLKAAEEGLKQGKIVIVDNTNPQVDTRNKYQAIAKKYKAGYHSLYLSGVGNANSKQLSFHLNSVRVANTMMGVERLSSIPIHMYYKKLEVPTSQEGFDTLSVIPFIPRLHPLYTETNQKPSPPPLGPTPIDPTTPIHLQPSTTNPTLNKHPEHLKEFGHVSKSRTLNDYFYQWYE